MSEQFDFSQLSDTTKSAAYEVLTDILESKKYNSNKTSEWIDNIGQTLVSHLRDMSPNFKYIVSTAIIQKVGAGIHFETASYWDNNTDAVIVVKYENDTMIAICNVVGIAI